MIDFRFQQVKDGMIRIQPGGHYARWDQCYSQNVVLRVHPEADLAVFNECFFEDCSFDPSPDELVKRGIARNCAFKNAKILPAPEELKAILAEQTPAALS
jgi:hypothetical protein